MDRLNKYIASCGVCSRRKAEELILSSRVKVNGKITTELGTKVEDTDVIQIDDKVISKEIKKVYIALNKPRGYVTTSHEQFNRKSVLELIDEDVRVYPIGRLDMYTEGLLLLTNDGDFANSIMHPKNKIEKTYMITTKDEPTKEQIEELENGVDIGDYITQGAKVKKIDKNTLQITISEGKNRQIRRMCEATDITLTNLKRVRIAGVELKSLKTGKYRYLTQDEIKSIK